ncbi:MAG: hypothetical protein D4R45_03240 [Planctomycetaceae bacterium]|nr:MAG: hypothetical protein D4R45_03240 [Planctomycetaceae bacterium]
MSIELRDTSLIGFLIASAIILPCVAGFVVNTAYDFVNTAYAVTHQPESCAWEEYYAGFYAGHDAGMGLQPYEAPPNSTPYGFGYNKGYCQAFGINIENATFHSGGGITI